MENTNANQPAFARAAWDMKVQGEGWIGAPAQDGLTKREYFAILAMQGMLANPECFKLLCEKVPPDQAPGFVADAAIEQADALLNQLNTKP